MQVVKKVSIALLIMYMVNLPFFFTQLIELNFGLSVDLPIPLLFLALPTLTLLSFAVLNQRLRLPHLWLFLLVEVAFIFMESEYFRGNNHTPSYFYPYYLFILYTLFISFVNFGTWRFHINRIMVYYLAFSFGLMIVVYLGYMGFFNYYIESGAAINDPYLRPIGGGMHANGLSMICVISILFLTINKQVNRSHFDINVWLENLLVFFFFSMILYNSSRGAFLISAVILFFYFQKDWHRFSTFSKVLLVNSTIIVFAYFLYSTFYMEVTVIQRFHDPDAWVSRTRQIIVTWKNFVENPLTGVGYFDAARNVIAGYTRSNFHYTQILASNGIFYFPFYLWFLVKLFGFSFKKPIPFMLAAAGFGALMFYNWSLIFSLALVAYLKYTYTAERPINDKRSDAIHHY